MSRMDDQAALEQALANLSTIDARLIDVARVAGMPPLRRRDAGFAGLATIIVGQQLSVASASAIWGRLSKAFDPFHHGTVCKARADRLGRLGLSAAKIKTIKAIGKAIASGALDLDALATLHADEAHAALTAVHGIGPWTADIYLLFCIGHADAFPSGDLALQEAVRHAFGLKSRPTAKELLAIAEAWRPFRGAAAHLFWAYYHAIKSQGGASVIAGEAKAKPPQKTAKKRTRRKG